MTLSPQTDKAVGLLASLFGILVCGFLLIICLLMVGCGIAIMMS